MLELGDRDRRTAAYSGDVETAPRAAYNGYSG